MLPRHEGEKLVCPLLARLAALGVPVLVVAEYDPLSSGRTTTYAAETRATTDAVLTCATAAGLATLDLFETIDEARAPARTRGSIAATIRARASARRGIAAAEKRHIRARSSRLPRILPSPSARISAH